MIREQTSVKRTPPHGEQGVPPRKLPGATENVQFSKFRCSNLIEHCLVIRGMSIFP